MTSKQLRYLGVVRDAIALTPGLQLLNPKPLQQVRLNALTAGVNKAEALQRAQLAVFASQKSPYFWAPFVLVGNWL